MCTAWWTSSRFTNCITSVGWSLFLYRLPCEPVCCGFMHRPYLLLCFNIATHILVLIKFALAILNISTEILWKKDNLKMFSPDLQNLKQGHVKLTALNYLMVSQFNQCLYCILSSCCTRSILAIHGVLLINSTFIQGWPKRSNLVWCSL
jgi:hypothetical protein